MRIPQPHGAPGRNPDLSTLYQSVREASARLGAPLSDADATVQSMPDASPAKWHLAHTTWFFERMILEPNLPGYRAFDPQFNFLFNSYYESIGARQPRPRRGMITRPALETIIAYRDHVDRAMASLMQDDLAPAVAELIELGCNHEQQHQELLLTDILHLFAQNPLRPAYKDPGPIAVGKTDSAPPCLSASSMAAWWRSGTTAQASLSIARGRGIACWSNLMNSRTGSSPTRNGWRSSPMAAIEIPCSGSPPDGRRCCRKVGRRRFIGKSARTAIGR